MTADNIYGHKRQIEIIDRAVRNNKTPHAYLFSGPEGIGKRQVAMRLAKSLQCDSIDKPCDNCIACKKVTESNHPDIFAIEPDGQFIKVEQIRELQKKLGYKPFEGKASICIIDGADKLNISAANSLLKTLEEPPMQTHLILIAENMGMVIPTILSRCQRIKFSALPDDDVKRFIEKNGLPDCENLQMDIKTLTAMSGGSLGKAWKLAKSFSMEEKSLLIEEFSRMDSADKAFLLAEQLTAKDRIDSLMEKLELLKFFIRDVMLAKLGAENRLVNSDKINIIKTEAERFTIRDIIARIKLVSETERAIRMNANKRLAVENMLLKLNRESRAIC